MRKEFDALLTAPDETTLLTTGEAARLLGVSRQHVVDLIDRGELPAIRVGSHRRVQHGDVLAVRRGSSRATRDQERSLWLGVAVAGVFVQDPRRVREAGLAAVTSPSIRSNRWTAEWAKLLRGPAGPIIRALTADTVHARELRQNSPFAGVLGEEQRTAVLEAFRADRHFRAQA
ncbi:helix-turn-helix domain-containing protein [Microbacterium hominis]|uniref:helix-turn-helix domain-containing protein n=1 Tax=Microbacterium TaxID=33882 RepID=UPI00168B7E2B|nr:MULTISPECIES: helix-turn-helix domain-containing protein [Microbacterium]QOC27261.1 helix-turn-helix domain-containing protein [Microbacterium hominis]QOC28405.1 helix-turn-helix domain-containing protein [Microbacterium hominis]QYF96402.1 helix-turn-helix domain-containing protein [Microbacterium sp. PAMC21962]